jgi:hypothetical protein
MPDPSSFQYLVSFGDLRTGQLVGGPLPVTAASFTSTLNDAGSATGITLNLSNSALARVDIRRLTAPARKFVFIEYGQPGRVMLPVWGGPVWSQSYSRKDRTVSIGAAGIASIFDHRKVVRALGADKAVAKSNLSYQDYSYPSLAIALVKQAQQYTGGDLPIVMPSVTGGGGHDRQWFGWELQWCGELLDSLSSLDGGPDIAFTAHRKTAGSNFVEWVMRLGDESTPEIKQDGPDWVWDDTVHDSSVTDISSDVDGSKLGTRVWVPGDGIESDRIVGSAEDLTLVQAGYPMLDAEDTTHTSVTLQSTLDGYATEMLRARAHPAETWKLTVRADRGPVLGTYQPGDYARILLRGDPFLPDGTHRVRILEVSGSLDHRVSLTTAPTEGLV